MEDWITLNVGGTKFTTTRAVLTSEPDSMLAKMFEHEGAWQPGKKDKDGAYLIDGNPKYFEPILQFLRRGKVIIDPEVSHEGVLEEARYFGVQSLVCPPKGGLGRGLSVYVMGPFLCGSVCNLKAYACGRDQLQSNVIFTLCSYNMLTCDR